MSFSYSARFVRLKYTESTGFLKNGVVLNAALIFSCIFETDPEKVFDSKRMQSSPSQKGQECQIKR
jgi:hypothetical protein